MSRPLVVESGRDDGIVPSMTTHEEYLINYWNRLADEDTYEARKYWADMTFGPNLMTKIAKWTGETWMAAHPEHDGFCVGQWTEYGPSHLITTCCYGNCTKWAHGHTATHRWFTPGSGLPFVALCKGHAKERRDAGVGHDIVAYSTLVRLRDEASTKAYDAYKRIRALWSDRGIYPKLIDRAEETLGRWEQREIVRTGRAYGLDN